MPHRKTDPPRGLLKTSAAAAPDLVHERFHPSEDLAPWVEHYWTVAWDLRGRPPHPVASLPHPSVHLVFEKDDRGGVAGPARARFSRMLENEGRAFAVKFRPGGFHPFAGGPVSRFADRTEPVADVFGAAGVELERSVLAADSSAERMRLVESFLRGLQPDPDPNVARVAELVAGVAREPGIVKVQHLVARSGLGLRTLQRLFGEYVGVGPKWVIQRYRLHEAAERLAAGPVDQSALALEVGYSDQSHFIRDFKAMVGVTPAAYARNAAEHGRDVQE